MLTICYLKQQPQRLWTVEAEIPAPSGSLR